MTVDDQDLRKAYAAAAGDSGEISIAGRKISRLGRVGIILADGQNILELDPDEQYAILRGLNEAARQAERDDYLDPAKNPMVKVG